MLIVYDLFNLKLIVAPNCDFRRNLYLISFISDKKNSII